MNTEMTVALTEKGFTDALKVVAAACEAGKWTLIAPDGRVWVDANPMIPFKALGQAMAGKNF
jgi:hypothetical protein